MHFILVFVVDPFLFQQAAPFFGDHFLMCHEWKILGFNCPAKNGFPDRGYAKVDINASRMIRINLHKVWIAPFFDNLLTGCFLNDKIVYSAFQVYRYRIQCIFRYFLMDLVLV